MAKASKYEALVGSVVNGVLVSNYVREQRTSKSGRNYSVGRLTVALASNTTKTINISIDSWRKWSFIKRLAGKTSKTGKTVKKVKQMFELMVIANTGKKQQKQQQTDMEVLRTTYSLKQLKKLYRKLANETHSDKGGDAKVFNEITTIYKYRKDVLKDTKTLVEEMGFTEDDELFAVCVDLRVAMDNYKYCW